MSPRTDSALHAADHWRRCASQAAHPSAASDDVSLLEAIAAGLAAVTVPWELDPRQTAEPRNELVLSTEVYDAWIIHWPPGHTDDIHDHRGSAGAFAVVSGTLTEECCGTAGTVGVTRVSAGDARAFAASTIHRISNRGRHTATSVHVYSPPLGAAHDGHHDHRDSQDAPSAAVDVASTVPPSDPPHHPHP